MAFWNKETPEQKAARLATEQEQARSLAELEAGKLPLRAQRRLKEQAEQGGFFTSDLTANEHFLARQVGFDPLGQVMGSAFYKVAFRGYYQSYYQSTGELASLTHAQLAARSLAVSRLKQEAALLGADGVIGVRLKHGDYDWSSNLVEFTAIGTAIRLKGRTGTVDEPFTSALDGQDFWKLYQSGYLPKEIAYGLCSYYIHGGQQARMAFNSFWGTGMANQEISQFSEGFQRARHLAMERFAQEVRRCRGQGAVGVKIDWEVEDIEYEVNDRTYHDLLVNFAAVGTAISERSGSFAPRASTLTFMSLKE